MASLSLPRVLQLKKNSLDAEREQFEKFQTLAIQKAINTIETPVKEKHVRSTIIGTFQEQSAVTYWMVALRQPLQDNRIVAWKFCHVTHKLLREGHPACLDDSQRHINMIENLAKLWVHLREGYGRLIHLYCNLLVTKLKFHARNPRFPGNMQLTVDELDAIAENDVNNYFQLCVELFDYMDDILTLQAAVFDSLGNARANSMTASGQCRLAALIPCAQDSSHIYDCNVRLLFRLHASLPPDVLAGHRERFRQQFKKLSSFYKHASSLQYYRNLLTLPVLPSNPPNFLLQSDFGTYVAPVVSIPEQPPDDIDTVGSLIDTSDTISQATTPDNIDMIDTRTTPSPVPDPIVERDRLIDHLQNELKRMRLEVSQIVQERNTMLGSMREHCARMESQFTANKKELEQEKQKAEIIFAEKNTEVKKKLTENEEKSKVLDEKFQKLKGAYTQLREEHIALIRQKAEVDKLAASLRASAAQHESSKTMLQQQLNDRMKDVELLQQSASSSEEVEAYKTEIANLRIDLEQSRQKETELESLKASMEALEIEHKTATTEQEEKLKILSSDLKEAKENVEKLNTVIIERDSELNKVNEELLRLKQKSGDEYKKIIEEKEYAVRQLSELKQRHDLEKEGLKEELSSKTREFENILKDKNTENNAALEKLNEIEIVKNNNDKIIQEQSNKINNLQQNIDELLKNKLQTETAITEFEKQIETLNQEIFQQNAEKTKLETLLSQNIQKISSLENEIKILLDSDSSKDELLKELESSKSDQINVQIAKITELETILKLKDETIYEFKLKDEENNTSLENKTLEIEKIKCENELEIVKLNTKLQNVITSKDSLIEDLKSKISEKENHLIALNADCKKSNQNICDLTDLLKKSQTSLDCCNNELSSLKKNHDSMLVQFESTITTKNDELKEAIDKITEMTTEKIKVDNERDLLIKDKQVLEQSLLGLQDMQIKLNIDLDKVRNERDNIENTFKQEIEKVKTEYQQFEIDAESKINKLKDEIQCNEITYKNDVTDKEESLNKAKEIIHGLKSQLTELEEIRTKEKDDLEASVSMKDKEVQLTEARLAHTENERLNAECELQDLLQQNTVLEADMALLKRQLDEANSLIKKQTWRLVACASESALEVLNRAYTAFENMNAQDANKLAAELAAKAFEELARKNEIEGNEELVAKSAIFAAQNAAQLSAYVSDLSNISTDMELSDKLNNECRNMLTSTKQCLETIIDGSLDRTTCMEARVNVQSVARTAAAADRLSSGARSVDDELADMDSAIEDAANQIEEMLAASRAGDSGVKLEVNGKILDACTTLMGAVKILVQDSRKLQNELGDPKTRQKMYRRNPQWSEGLISASKAVVFAAKLLVSSADEAVGAAGRVEGVSAAAHEVAGSTAQLVAASRARAPPASPALARLTAASRAVAAATGAVVAAVRGASALVRDQEALDTSALSLTATRRLEMDSKVRALELESALEAERARLAALRKRHYHLAQMQENGNMTNGEE